MATEYVDKLIEEGFISASTEPARIYTREDAQELVTGTSCCGNDAHRQMASLDGAMMSAFVRAVKL